MGELFRRGKRRVHLSHILEKWSPPSNCESYVCGDLHCYGGLTLMYAHINHRNNTAKTERSATIPRHISTSGLRKQTEILTLTPRSSTCTCIAPPHNHRHTETSNIHICRVCHDTQGDHNHQLPTNPFQLAKCSFPPFLKCSSRCLLNDTTELSLGHNWGTRGSPCQPRMMNQSGEPRYLALAWHLNSLRHQLQL